MQPHQKGPSTCSVILCNRINITVSFEFGTQEQSFVTHHNQMDVQFGVIKRRLCEGTKVRDTCGYSANTISVKTMAGKKKQLST